MEALLAAGFVETVFHCPACGTAGTSFSRPAALLDRRCLDCGEPVVTTVLDRFARPAGDE
jgi:ribosomal protein S27E